MAGERLEKALLEFRKRYHTASRVQRSRLLDEFCELTGYHRKYAIVVLRRPTDEKRPAARRLRGPTYSAAAVRVLETIWMAADYPWSVRLKALLPLWLPWARVHVRGCNEEVVEQLLRMSPRQMDRRLARKKCMLKRTMYGRTKPGSLLKQQIPVRTDFWDTTEPGWCEIDLVSHSGPHASGEFLYSLNLTDIHTGWCETRCIRGKGETGVVAALEDIRQCLPFALKGIDSDNGSEFINHHLVRYCEKHRIQFTRSRPYKKNDNAHIEQKNWTHVRRIFGWDRLDTPAQQCAMNALYTGELRLMMNLFQPCVKLVSKERIGSRVRRHYDTPQTPLDRLITSSKGKRLPQRIARLKRLRDTTNPFTLSEQIAQGCDQLHDLPDETTQKTSLSMWYSDAPSGA